MVKYLFSTYLPTYLVIWEGYHPDTSHPNSYQKDRKTDAEFITVETSLGDQRVMSRLSIGRCSSKAIERF